MRLLTLFLFLFSLISCDTPMKTRDPGVSAGGSGIIQGGDGNVTDGSDKENEDGEDEGDGDGEEDNMTDVGFEQCNTNYQYFAGSAIGYMALCQSDNVETQFKVKLQNSDFSVGTCFVPVYIQSNGNSFKLGIAECVHNEADKVYDMILTKERSETINGVMVLKANALTPYMQCMSAKVDYLNAYPGCQMDYNCSMAADQYAQAVCSSFVSNYANYYKQISL